MLFIPFYSNIITLVCSRRHAIQICVHVAYDKYCPVKSQLLNKISVTPILYKICSNLSMGIYFKRLVKCIAGTLDYKF